MNIRDFHIVLLDSDIRRLDFLLSSKITLEAYIHGFDDGRLCRSCSFGKRKNKNPKEKQK